MKTNKKIAELKLCKMHKRLMCTNTNRSLGDAYVNPINHGIYLCQSSLYRIIPHTRESNWIIFKFYNEDPCKKKSYMQLQWGKRTPTSDYVVRSLRMYKSGSFCGTRHCPTMSDECIKFLLGIEGRKTDNMFVTCKKDC